MKRLLFIVAGILILLLAADEYPALRFRGDGKFSGGPVFGYRISMRAIPFYKSGEYVFRFSGLPKQEMSLQLYVKGQSGDDRAELTHLGTTLDANLIDQNGRTVCQATGMVRDGQNERIWILMSDGEAAFWHWNCVHLPLKPSDSYTLTLRISNIDPKTPHVNLMPVLEGGRPDLT